MAFADTCKFTAGSSGTSDFTDGTAVTGFRNLSGGAVSGQDYSYRAFSTDYSQWENGHGVYNGTALARTTQYETSTGSKVSFSSAPTVILTPLKADLDADQARRNMLLGWAQDAKANAGYLRMLNTFIDGYKASDGVNSGSSTNYAVTTGSGYAGPTSVAGSAYGPGAGAGGGAYNNSSGNNTGNGKSSSGYGAGAGGGAGSNSSGAGVGVAGTQGLVVISYNGKVIVLTTTGANTWAVPSDWNSATNTIEVLGAGGGSGSGVNAGAAGAGGGGGGYSKIVNLTLTPGANVNYTVGVAGALATAGGDTWFNGTTLGGSSVGAKGGGAGTSASGSTPGVGGTGGAAASGVGTTKQSGGNGGDGSAGAGGKGGGGGGGAAGPNGDGKNAGSGSPAGGNGGGGGGAANNGSAGTGGASAGNTGGAGGNGRGATGGGAAGNPGADGSAGTGGGGGGGSGGNQTQANLTGGAGAQDNVWTSTALTNNMTLLTTTQTADATVSWGRVLLEIDNIDSGTLNTDLTVEVTADNGSHWASATLSSIGKGQAGRTVVETADTSFGANTDTSFAARIKTLNNKMINVYKTAMVVH